MRPMMKRLLGTAALVAFAGVAQAGGLVPGCPGDVTGDRGVDLTDLNVVLGAFGGPGPAGDVNLDGEVNLQDLNVVLEFLGTTCPGPVITDVQPRTMSEGTVLTITGEGLGDDAADLCMSLLLSDGGNVGLYPMSTEGNTVLARVTTYTPGPSGTTKGVLALAGHLNLAIGVGDFQILDIPGQTLCDPIWFWEPVDLVNPAPELIGGFVEPIEFIPGGVPGGLGCTPGTFSGGVDPGDSFKMVLSGTLTQCPQGTSVEFHIRARENSTSPSFQFFWENFYCFTVTTASGDPEECLDTICQQLSFQLNNAYPGLGFSCSTVVNSVTGAFTITLQANSFSTSGFDPNWSYNKFDIRICLP